MIAEVVETEVAVVVEITVVVAEGDNNLKMWQFENLKMNFQKCHANNFQIFKFSNFQIELDVTA
jgi:hypothetical protein